ncbi:hypothetical protein BDAP_001322 [Binucleata daphniae]
MVRKTIIFEKTYLTKPSKLSKQMYPLMSEAKYKFYNYYNEFLRLYIDKDHNIYLQTLIDSME